MTTDSGYYGPAWADACLIAAAPDLYAACQRALAVETSVTQGQERERREGYIELLRAALAKAEGQEKA